MNMVALIAGPTASGKSALALALAERTDGVIVNADSAQVYRNLPILSAAPSQEDRARAEHRLYGIRDGAEPCSAAEWATLAKREITDIHKSARQPILVGGTGLYLRTLLDGIAPVPEIDPHVRKRVRYRSAEENGAELRSLDPVAAERLNPADSTRIARALEVVLSTGRPLSDWQSNREGGIVQGITLRPIVLLPPREWLYERCNRRFESMIEHGAFEEVKALLARNLDPALPVTRAIGVREIAAYLAGDTDRAEMISRGAQATRNYAKRQYTWFARQAPPEWPRYCEPVDADSMSEALALLRAAA